MATLFITDANTGQLVEIDTENPSGSISVVDANTGELVLLDLSSPAGILNVVDADTGDIFEIDYSNLTGVLHVNDANTGDVVEIDLSNPEFSIYVNDENTGDLVLLTRSGGPPPDTTPSYETPSYSNTGGTGDRTSFITVTTDLTVIGDSMKVVNGLKGSDEGYYWSYAITPNNNYWRFQFPHPVVINEMKYYRTNAPEWHYLMDCVCKWQGSINGTDWTDLTGTFTPTTTPSPYTWTELAANSTGYNYYQLLIISGTPTYYENPIEIEFKIGNPL